MTGIQFPADFDEGLVAGRYRFLSGIGQGGMGTTSRYWDIVDGRPVVIKQPRREFVEKPGFLARFDREVRLMRSLPHPHIVPVIDAGEHAGLPFIVMPFLPGGSLSVRRLRDAEGRPLANPPSMLHLWLPGIAAALDHVHAQGAVHRDVKPANIFFDAFWHASLGDFGVAKIVDETAGLDREQTLTGTHVAVGTEFYMAPETYQPKAVFSGTVDQYALAVVVYEMLCGRRPFTGETAHIIVESTTQPAPPLDRQQRGLPPGLVQAVHRGLAKRPEERFGSCGEFVRAALADVPPLAPEPGVARLACPKCNHLIKIAASDGGKRGQCPKCRKRLTIADDLCALWTRDEQAIVAGQPPASWPGGDLEPAAEATTDDVATFTPVSRPTPVPRRPPVMNRRLQIAAGLAAFSLVGLLAVAPVIIKILWPPPPVFRLDERAGVVVDEARGLRAFPPVGWRRAPKSGESLVTFEPKRGDPVPQILVVANAGPPPTATRITAGMHDAWLWSEPAAKLALPGSFTGRACGIRLGEQSYAVRVTAAANRPQDAEQLARLVAGGLQVEVQTRRVPTGLRVQFFKDRHLQEPHGKPEIWPDVTFDWPDGTAKGLPRQDYSARWTGTITPRHTGVHTFSGRRDDGLRLTIKGRRIVDEWHDGQEDYRSKEIHLEQDTPYPIEIEWFNGNGPACLSLEWTGPTGEAEPVPNECLRPGP